MRGMQGKDQLSARNAWGLSNILATTGGMLLRHHCSVASHKCSCSRLGKVEFFFDTENCKLHVAITDNTATEGLKTHEEP